VWQRIKHFMYENWLALTALLASLFTFIFCRHRRTGLDNNKQLCVELGDSIAGTQQSIKDSQSEIGTVTDRLDELSNESKSVADICRKYGTGDNTTNKE
jgi:hypothetical protein